MQLFKMRLLTKSALLLAISLVLVAGLDQPSDAALNPRFEDVGMRVEVGGNPDTYNSASTRGSSVAESSFLRKAWDEHVFTFAAEPTSKFWTDIFKTEATMPTNEALLTSMKLTEAERTSVFLKVSHTDALVTKLGVHLEANLFFQSLPATYFHRETAAVLAASGQLKSAAVGHRVKMTGNIMLNKILAGLQSKTGKGMFYALALGHFHKLRRQAAKDASIVHPINQESNLWTLLTFQLGTLHGVTTFSAEEKSQWIRTWWVIGSFLGIADENNPVNFAQAESFRDKIKAGGEIVPGDVNVATLLATLKPLLQAVNSAHDFVANPMGSAFLD